MSIRQFVRYMRFTTQGVAIASLGTLGLSPTWGAFIEGIVMLFASLALMTIEKKEG